MNESITLVAVFADVTEQRRSEDVIHQSEERFRALAVHSPMGIFQCDLDGNGLFVNDRYAAIAGIESTEIAGLGWLRTLHPLDRPRVLDAWCRAAASGREFSEEFRFVHGDGTLHWALANAVALQGDSCTATSYLGNVLDITERKAADDALRASEQRFRMLSDLSPVGIFSSDETGHVVYINERSEGIYGYPATELFGLGFLRIFLPAERDAILANWLQIAGGTDQHDVERMVVNRRGEPRWIHLSSVPMISSTGGVVGRIGTVEDITERRLAEQGLRDSEERFRLLTEHASDVISRHNAHRVVIYVSPACQTLLGYKPDELVGTDGLQIIHPDDRRLFRPAPGTSLESIDTLPLTYRVQHKNGQYIWLETLWKLIPRSAGSGEFDVEIVAMSRDVTLRRQAAERLSASEARLCAILDTASDGIVTVDEAGGIEQFSPGAERLFGYRAAEVLGHNARMLFPREESAIERSERRPIAFRRPLAKVREIVGRRKDGTLCELEISVGEAAIGSRSVFTAILHDITSRKSTERRLRESEKLAATGRIAARVAHEINNPLAGIKNSFLLIKDAVPPDHPDFCFVARIEGEIDRIARIVRQMFDLHRPSRFGCKAVDELDLGMAVRDVAALLEPIATTREVRLEIELPSEGHKVPLSADSVRQVLYNVVVNAIEASPRGESVCIEARGTADSVELYVTDHGPGIPPEVAQQIYEPFFTTKARVGIDGLGLGLSISRGIVEAMCGTLDFQSGPCGTVFHIHLPAFERDGEPGHAAHTQDPVG